MRYGYVRVSTEEQNLGRQIDLMEKLGVDVIIEEKESGKDIDNRPKLKALLELLQEGDVLVVESISRLSRSVYDFLTLAKELEERGIELISHKENFDTSNAYGRFAMNIFASLYQMERELMKDRQREGIEIARKNGVQFGRPKVKFDKELFEDLVEKNIRGFITGERASAELGISLATYNRRKKEYVNYQALQTSMVLEVGLV